MHRQDNRVLGKMSAKQSLQKKFFKIVFFGSLIPLFFSFFFLYYLIKINNEKIFNYNLNESKKIELSLQNSFTRIADSLHKISTSSQIKELLNSTFQNEKSAQNNFNLFLEKEKKLIGNQNISYCIYGAQRNRLYGETLCPLENEISANGIYFLEPQKIFLFNTLYSSLNKPSLTLTAAVSLNSINQEYPSLFSFSLLSNDLSDIQLKANLKNGEFNNEILFFFYFAILICALICLISILYGIHIAYTLKNNAQDALKLATIGKVAQVLAHDIQKPFQNIAYFSQELPLCKDKIELDYLVLQTKNSIQSSQKFIENLLSELMDANEHSLHIEKNLNLQDILHSCIESFPTKQLTQNVNIEMNLKHTYPLEGDVLKLKRVFLNIIANALDEIQKIPNSKIRITSFNSKKNVCIEFFNSHSFISKENIKNIFEPFYTKKETGTGLGLPISKKIIELHGGQISCTSKKKEGVKFTITLPIQNENHSNSSKRANNIFLIDDCPLTLKAWKRKLQTKHESATIHTFLNFEDFFRFIKENNIFEKDIQMIVCDYLLPNSKISLPDALKKIKRFYSKPVYISTNMPESVVKDVLKKFNIIILDKNS